VSTRSKVKVTCLSVANWCEFACRYNCTFSRFISFSGDLSASIRAMLKSKGHENIEELSSDAVLVNIMAKKNEDVWGTADKTRNPRAGAATY